MRATKEAGFTLPELLTVVAIVGILGALASSRAENPPDAKNLARTVALRVADASDAALTAGPVAPSLVELEADGYRARLVIETDDDGQQFMAVEHRVEEEDESESYYEELQRDYLDPDLEIYAIDAGTAHTESGASPTAGGNLMTLPCTPDGKCGPATLFLQEKSGDLSTRYRVVVMPLNSSPVVLNGW